MIKFSKHFRAFITNNLIHVRDLWLNLGDDKEKEMKRNNEKEKTKGGEKEHRKG